MQLEIEEIISEISQKRNIPFEVVKSVVYSQFEAARIKLSTPSALNDDVFPNVRIKNLGIFVTTSYRIARLKAFYIEKNKKINI